MPDAPWDLIERLDAAALDSHNVHNDLCASFTEGQLLPCSCGIPQLLADAAGFVRSLAVETMIGQAQRTA